MTSLSKSSETTIKGFPEAVESHLRVLHTCQYRTLSSHGLDNRISSLYRCVAGEVLHCIRGPEGFYPWLRVEGIAGLVELEIRGY